MRGRSRVRAALRCCGAAAICLWVAACGRQEAAGLVIADVTVISPERPTALEHAYVRIVDGRIVDISVTPLAGDRILDGAGRFLIPGLIDGHVHLGEVPGMRPEDEREFPRIAAEARAQIPRSYLLYGYTTVVDTISTQNRTEIWNALETRPDAYFCGATPVMGGYGMPRDTTMEQAFRDYPYLLVRPTEGARLPSGIDVQRHTPAAIAGRMKQDGAICLKAFAEDGFGAANNIPTIDLDTARSLTAAAHAVGLPVLMHANAVEHQQFAMDAGADIIAHGMWHWGEYSPEEIQAARNRGQGEIPERVRQVLERLADTGVGVQPTLQVLPGERDVLDPDYLDAPALRRVMPQSLLDWYRTPSGRWFRDVLVKGVSSDSADAKEPDALWAEAKGFYAPYMNNVASATAYLVRRKAKVLFGTDTPSAPTYANPPGLNGLREMERLVATGMTPLEILRAATILNAQAFGLQSEVGTVEVGKRANLLLLTADPTLSVQAYQEIEAIVVGGRVTLAADLVPNG